MKNTISCKDSLSLIQSDCFTESLVRVLFSVGKIGRVKVDIYELVRGVLSRDEVSKKGTEAYLDTKEVQEYLSSLILPEGNYVDYMEIFEKLGRGEGLSEIEKWALICFIEDSNVIDTVITEIGKFRDTVNIKENNPDDFQFDISALLGVNGEDGYTTLVNCIEGVSDQTYQIMYDKGKSYRFKRDIFTKERIIIK